MKTKCISRGKYRNSAPFWKSVLDKVIIYRNWNCNIEEEGVVEDIILRTGQSLTISSRKFSPGWLCVMVRTKDGIMNRFPRAQIYRLRVLSLEESIIWKLQNEQDIDFKTLPGYLALDQPGLNRRVFL